MPGKGTANPINKTPKSICKLPRNVYDCIINKLTSSITQMKLIKRSETRTRSLNKPPRIQRFVIHSHVVFIEDGSPGR